MRHATQDARMSGAQTGKQLPGQRPRAGLRAPLRAVFSDAPRRPRPRGAARAYENDPGRWT
ncbi:hypothetical protein GCM10009603_63690 [Nocardiopsis exhalans]